MKSLVDLDANDCRYPIGDTDIQFCAKPVHVYMRDDKLSVSSYCHEHHLICTYVPSAKRVAA